MDKKWLVVVLVLALCCGMLPAAVAEEPIVLSIGKGWDGSGTAYPEGHSVENNYYLDYVREKAGVEIQFDWVLADASQKVALAVASGSMPDVMLVDQMTYDMLLNSDMLLPMTEAYESAAPDTLIEFVYSLFPEALEAGYVGDELMSLPSTASLHNHNVCWIRQDWLDNLGLDTPETLDDLVNVARAFVENDPDGNGADDTIGIALKDDPFGNMTSNYDLQPIAGAFHAFPGIWYAQEDGSMVYGSVTDTFRDTLEFLAGLYADNLLYKEFAVGDAEELVINGQCGLAFGQWSFSAFALRQSHTLDGADWVPILCPLDEDGKFVAYERQPVGNYVVVSKNCKNPEAVIDVINAEYSFHWGIDLDEEWAAKLLEYESIGVLYANMPIEVGMERSHTIPERRDGFAQYLETGSLEGLSSSVQSYVNSYIEWLDDPTSLTGWAWYRGMYLAGGLLLDERVDADVQVAFWGVTETMEDMWTTLETMEEETIVKIIMGEASIDAYDAFVESWYALGGEQITQEVQAYVDSR